MLLPIVWAGLIVAALAVPLSTSPLPWTDLAHNMSGAAANSWWEILVYSFRPNVEYRPLLHLWVKGAYELFGVGARPYFALLLLQFAAVLGLLVWLFRPVGTRRGIAAAVAIACLAGLHSSRALFHIMPVNAYSMGVILLLAAAILAVERPNARLDWLLLFLTGASVLLLESGLVVLPVVAVLLVRRAPGVSWRGAAATLAVVALYVAVRRRAGAEVPFVYTETGLGFGIPSVEEMRGIFESAPWMFYAYNSISTLFTVLFSEPRQGVFVFVQSLLQDAVPGYKWVHVLTSTFTTLLVGIVLIALRPFSARDRLLVAIGLVLIVFGSALGFLYTRDRIALTAGVGYVLLVYVCVAQLLERARAMVPWRRACATVAVAALALGWTIRTGEAGFQLRDAAWDFQMEWRHRFGDRPAGPAGSIEEQLRLDALSRTPADPTRDPSWSYRFFERKF